MDMNLLRVFAAVFEEGSVTHAAARLHMAQPSVTQALNRLRRVAGEALFVREGRGIVPTRAARQLYAEVGAMPAAAEAAIARLTAFAPEQAQETFRIALTDLGQMLFLPTLGPALTRIAPRSRLEVMNLDVATAPEELRTGRIDLAVSSVLLADDLRVSVIREDVYCCVARRGRFGQSTPSFDELTSVPRIVAKNSIGHTLVEASLPAPVAGSISLPAFSAIPAVLAASDLIAFVPRGVLPVWSHAWDLVDMPLPPGRFTSLVRAHTAEQPMSSSNTWFTRWAIDTLRSVPSPAATD